MKIDSRLEGSISADILRQYDKTRVSIGLVRSEVNGTYDVGVAGPETTAVKLCSSMYHWRLDVVQSQGTSVY